MGVISPRSLRLLVGKRIFFSVKLFQLFPVAAIKRQHCAPRYEDLFSALTDLFNFYPNPRIRIKVENFGSCPGLPYQCFALFNPLKGFVISGGDSARVLDDNVSTLHLPELMQFGRVLIHGDSPPVGNLLPLKDPTLASPSPP